MELSVIVVTLNRPDSLRRCLECLAAQEPAAAQVIVVDGSTDERSREVALAFPRTEYLRNPRGYGHMTLSRNLGLRAARGDIVAFLDDDAFARSGWSGEILRPYGVSPDIAGVGGRALNLVPGEETRGRDQIGKLLPDGRLTANFAADCGELIDVAHLIGCNMSFRRSVLARLGGLRAEYPGTEVREETDVCLRVRALGGRLVYNAAAVVEHVGAGQAKGKRFDLRYEFYAKRNHTYLLLRNFGPGSAVFLCNLVGSTGEILAEAGYKLAAALGRAAYAGAGIVAGLSAGLGAWARRGTHPVRHDAEGREMAGLLSEPPASPQEEPATDARR